MSRFLTESLFQISEALRDGLERGPVLFEVVDPDQSHDLFSGESIVVCGETAVYRTLQTWFELAEVLGAALETPERLSDGYVRLRMRPLRAEKSWHEHSRPSGDLEKYGVDTDFFRTSKLEMPSFLHSYLEAIRFLKLPDNARVLSVGVNHGDELAIFEALGKSESMSFVGIDHCPSAISEARRRYPGSGYQFFEADVRDLNALELGTYDLVVAINTLHSAALDGHGVFREVLKKHVRRGGGVIVGVPNSRTIDHQLVYGARMKNYSSPELSLLWKEVGFYRRYLHQHDYRVRVLGKHTILIVGKQQGL